MLTADRDTTKREGKLASYPLAAGARLFAGGLVCLNAAGFAVRGDTALNLMAVGRANENIDNTTGLAGALEITVEHGVFRYNNSLAGDAVTLASVGRDCFIVDDEQVALTNGGNTRSRAGVVMDVDARGVWVRIEPSN